MLLTVKDSCFYVIILAQKFEKLAAVFEEKKIYQIKYDK